MTTALQNKDLAAAGLTLRLQKGRDKRVRTGHPWIYSNEIDWPSGLKHAAPGTAATFFTSQGDFLGHGFFNPKSLIAGRILSRDEKQKLDVNFFRKVIQAALLLRAKYFAKPYYRLIHAEADFMPGVIVDRFGDVLVVEINTAGMQNLMPIWMDVLCELTGAQTVYVRNDSSARQLEGLESERYFYRGEIAAPVPVQENGLVFYADIINGQKTGWFYDQRANRAMVADLCKDANVLDLYSYLGGFALAAGKSGAKSVLAVDRSEDSINLARRSAAENQMQAVCQFRTEQVFTFLEGAVASGEKFDVVIADPPAFAKSAKDLGAAKMGYRKLSQLCAGVVAPGGYLFIASCSYHMPVADFIEQVASGISKSGRSGNILRQTGADTDHPVHLHLPQTAYLKGLLIRLD